MTWMTPFDAEMSVGDDPGLDELAARQAVAVEHPVLRGRDDRVARPAAVGDVEQEDVGQRAGAERGVDAAGLNERDDVGLGEGVVAEHRAERGDERRVRGREDGVLVVVTRQRAGEAGLDDGGLEDVELAVVGEDDLDDRRVTGLGAGWPPWPGRRRARARVAAVRPLRIFRMAEFLSLMLVAQRAVVSLGGGPAAEHRQEHDAGSADEDVDDARQGVGLAEGRPVIVATRSNLAIPTRSQFTAPTMTSRSAKAFR